MVITRDATIPIEKIRDYLLKWIEKDDKSGFLKRGGYSRENYQQLIDDIREHLLPAEAVLQERRQDGELYRIRGILRGPNGRELRVRTVWLVSEDAKPRFITLVPDKEKMK
ncbi:MAG TPA: hypothetical protein VFH95_13665 [Candidatus Kapabacteria bacterium]|nr:hypothetical protein [Candidatus Kapabacteria bacterium]